MIVAMKSKNNNGGKKVRKHRGIHQIGGKAGKLKKGYKYSGKKLKSGKAEIIKVQVGGPIKRDNNNERLRKQLKDSLYIISPKDRYNEWKKIIPLYEYQVTNYFKDKKNSKFSKQEIKEKIEYMETNQPKMIKYEKKNNIVRDSVEMLKLYTMGQLKQEISEMTAKVYKIEEFITEVAIRIRFAKLNDEKLGKTPTLLAEAKVAKEEKYARLRIFINRKRVLEEQEKENDQQMERAFQQSNPQVITKKNKKTKKNKVSEMIVSEMIGGVTDELPQNMPRSLEKMIDAKKLKNEIVSMKEAYKNSTSTNQRADASQTIWFELLLSSGIPISDVIFLKANTLSEDKFDALINIYSSEPIKNYELKSLLKINKKMKQTIENPVNPNFVPGRELTLEERFERLRAGL